MGDDGRNGATVPPVSATAEGGIMTPEEAKALVAGPLGGEMAKFALRFCKPVFFGLPPSREHPVVVINGTASLLQFRDELLAVTCFHVIESYRRKLDEDCRCLFAVANCYFDPLAQLVAEDRAVDFAVLRLTPEQGDTITRDSNGIGEAFYPLAAQPPTPIKVDDFVAYGGFPSDRRYLTSFDELSFGTYSSGACRVTDVYSDYITCEFEREYWVKHFFEAEAEAEPETLGGLSGGPVFVIRTSSAGLVSYEYAGLIFGMDKSTEALFMRRAEAIPLGWEVGS